MKVKLGTLEDNGGLLQCTKFDPDRSRGWVQELEKVGTNWCTD